MNKYKIRWTDRAIKNMVSIGNYIENDSSKYAEIVVNELFNSTIILEKFPKIGRIVPEFNDDNIREIIRYSYRIVYKIIDKESIDVLSIYSTKQQIFGNNIIIT